jgi:glycerol 3-phosphatase-2
MEKWVNLRRNSTHRILDALDVPVHWFGKPFPEAFTEALGRLDLVPNRVVMVGDTLHTDTLGGAAAGCETVLITDHGLFRGHDTAPFIAACGIQPSLIIPSP